MPTSVMVLLESVTSMPTVTILVDRIFALVKLDSQEMVKPAQVKTA